MSSGHGSRWGPGFQMVLGLVIVLGWVLSEGHGSWVMGLSEVMVFNPSPPGNLIYPEQYLGSRIGIA
jgi:hypothetical protein